MLHNVKHHPGASEMFCCHPLKMSWYLPWNGTMSQCHYRMWCLRSVGIKYAFTRFANPSIVFIYILDNVFETFGDWGCTSSVGVWMFRRLTFSFWFRWMQINYKIIFDSFVSLWDCLTTTALIVEMCDMVCLNYQDKGKLACLLVNAGQLLFPPNPKHPRLTSFYWKLAGPIIIGQDLGLPTILFALSSTYCIWFT